MRVDKQYTKLQNNNVRFQVASSVHKEDTEQFHVIRQKKYYKGRLEYMRDTHYAYNLLCYSEGYLKIQMTGLISVKPYFQVALLSCMPSK
jgi:hypothetical protein